MAARTLRKFTRTPSRRSEDPDFHPTEKTKDWAAESKKYKQPKLTYEQRKANIAAKIANFQAQLAE